MSNKYQINIKIQPFLYVRVLVFDLRSYQFIAIHSPSLSLSFPVSLNQTRSFLLGPRLKNSTESSMKADTSLRPGT